MRHLIHEKPKPGGHQAIYAPPHISQNYSSAPSSSTESTVEKAVNLQSTMEPCLECSLQQPFFLMDSTNLRSVGDTRRQAATLTRMPSILKLALSILMLAGWNTMRNQAQVLAIYDIKDAGKRPHVSLG